MKIPAEEKTTERLEKILKTTVSETDAVRYITENTEGTYGSFKEFFDAYIAEKQLTIKDIRKNSGISPNYFYNVINADRNPGRDKVLALCIACGMNYDETNKALRLAKAGALNPKNKRDALIAIEINRRTGTVMNVNIVLEEEGLDIIE